MTPSLEGWPTKAKEAPSPHEVRMSPLDTDPVFQSLRGKLAILKYIHFDVTFEPLPLLSTGTKKLEISSNV